jgi:uncharacterized protein YdhG (YjbR/CyaY superfamily)
MAGPSSVDQYFAAVPPARRATLVRLRELIRAEAPAATEVISYQMPAFKSGGRMLVWYAPFADHFSLFPASDGVKKALGDALKPYLSGKGTIRFAADGPLPEDLIRQIVRIRLAEKGGYTVS